MYRKESISNLFPDIFFNVCHFLQETCINIDKINKIKAYKIIYSWLRANFLLCRLLGVCENCCAVSFYLHVSPFYVHKFLTLASHKIKTNVDS